MVGGAARWPLLGPELARRLELSEAAGTAAYVASQRICDPAAGSALVAIEPGPAYAVYAGPGSPVSRAIGLGMCGPVEPGVIDCIERFFGVRGEVARIDLCPLADGSLGRELSARRYAIAGSKQVFVMPLAAWDGGAGGAAKEVAVRPAGPGEGELWVETVGSGFASGGPPTPFHLSISRPSVGREDCTCLLAWVEGKPAGGGVVEIRNGLVLLRTQSTIARFRGRGVQTAVIGASLALARQAGCDLATVQTGPGTASQRNVERAGFRVAYTKPTLVQVRD